MYSLFSMALSEGVDGRKLGVADAFITQRLLLLQVKGMVVPALFILDRTVIIFNVTGYSNSKITYHTLIRC